MENLTMEEFLALYPRTNSDTHRPSDINSEINYSIDAQKIQWAIDARIYPVLPTRISRQNLETIDSYEGEF